MSNKKSLFDRLVQFRSTEDTPVGDLCRAILLDSQFPMYDYEKLQYLWAKVRTNEHIKEAVLELELNMKQDDGYWKLHCEHKLRENQHFFVEV